MWPAAPSAVCALASPVTPVSTLGRHKRGNAAGGTKLVAANMHSVLTLRLSSSEIVCLHEVPFAHSSLSLLLSPLVDAKCKASDEMQAETLLPQVPDGREGGKGA